MKRTTLANTIHHLGRTLFCLLLLFSFLQASVELAAAKAVLDFDGDGRTDYLVVRRPSTSASAHTLDWYVLLSSGGFMAMPFGNASTTVDRPIPEDYDGDGKCDFAVYRIGSNPLTLYYVASETNTFQAVELDGFQTADMTQDFDGDGRADPAQATLNGNNELVWRILESTTGNIRAAQFGTTFDFPVRGDYDGDGKADLALYRRPTGGPLYPNTFIILRSSDGLIQSEVFGNYQTDRIISADFDGDQKTDFAVWRKGFPAPDTGYWYWRESSTGTYRSLHFGIGSRDLPIPGDYDGDGKTDHAVSRRDPNPSPIEETTKIIFYVNQSSGGVTAVHWGNGYDSPLTELFSR